jgi:hypothetical protein
MKHFLKISLLFILFVSCKKNDLIENKLSKNSLEQEIKNMKEGQIKVIKYQDCEYIVLKEDKDSNTSYGFMAHKGNCSNPIHKCE